MSKLVDEIRVVLARDGIIRRSDVERLCSEITQLEAEAEGARVWLTSLAGLASRAGELVREASAYVEGCRWQPSIDREQTMNSLIAEIKKEFPEVFGA